MRECYQILHMSCMSWLRVYSCSFCLSTKPFLYLLSITLLLTSSICSVRSIVVSSMMTSEFLSFSLPGCFGFPASCSCSSWSLAHNGYNGTTYWRVGSYPGHARVARRVTQVRILLLRGSLKIREFNVNSFCGMSKHHRWSAVLLTSGTRRDATFGKFS